MLQTQSLGAFIVLPVVPLMQSYWITMGTVPINPEQFGRTDVTDFTNVTKVSPMKTLVILITFF